MTAKDRLKKYIEEDKIYNDWLNNKSDNFSDFDKFCIQHCVDIKELLKENQELKEKFKATNKGLQKVILKRKKWKDRYYKYKYENKKLKKVIDRAFQLLEILHYKFSDYDDIHNDIEDIQKLLKEVE